MARERLTTRDASGRPMLKSYAIDAQMAAVRRLAEYEDVEEKKKKTRKNSMQVKADEEQEPDAE